METDWHRRGHLLHDTTVAPTTTTNTTLTSTSASPSPAPVSTAASLPTLPGVAELIASSKPSNDSTPAAHAHQSNPLPPILRPNSSSSTAPPAPAPAPAALHANHLGSSELSYSIAVHHATHAGPTESPTSSTTSSQHYSYQPSNATAATNPYNHPLTSEACSALQDTLPSQTPINARRQDSAISHQRIGASKELLSFAAPSEANFPNPHQRPSDSNHRPTSPGLSAYPISHSSPPLPCALPIPSVPKSHEHPASSPAPLYARTGAEPLPRTLNPSPLSDNPSTNNTRQQRYNVRFAANHTPATMPSAQRSRQSPPLSTAPAPTETNQSPSTPKDDHTAPTIEPAIQAIARTLKQPDDSAQSDARTREPSVERCSGCNEIWSRPLPSSSEWTLDAPAESAKDFARATDNLIARIRQYGKDADQRYEQWKDKHSRCRSNRDGHPGSSPHYPAPADAPQRRSSNGHSHGSAQADVTSNKRKSEINHGDTSKIRKVTFDNHAATATATAPPIRPSAPI